MPDSSSLSSWPKFEVSLVDSLPGARFFIARAQVSWDSQTQTIGWGRSPQADVARRKALGEAAERHAFGRLPASAIWAQAGDLPDFVDPATQTGMEPAQYLAAGFPCSPFVPSESRWWLPASAVLGERSTWVLADCMCSPGAFDSAYRERLVTRATSSGCATANDQDTAICRATFELLERDAFMRHWFAQRAGSAIDLATLPAAFQQRFSTLREGGCSTGVQCLTLGQHPTLLAWAQHAGKHFTCIGTATGADAQEVLDAALCELEVPALARVMGVPEVLIEPGEVRTPADHSALYATAQYFRRADALWDFGSQKPASFDELQAAFAVSAEALYERLSLAGHALLWVDLSTAKSCSIPAGEPVHTVRVAAPGLIPLTFGSRLSPRAFDLWRAPGGSFIHPLA